MTASEPASLVTDDDLDSLDTLNVDDMTVAVSDLYVLAARLRDRWQQKMTAAVGEATDDLERLVAYAQQLTDMAGEIETMAGLTQGMLDEATWDRLSLASVLAAAVVQLGQSAGGPVVARPATPDGTPWPG